MYIVIKGLKHYVYIFKDNVYIHFSNFTQFHYFQHDTYQLLYMQKSTS